MLQNNEVYCNSYVEHHLKTNKEFIGSFLADGGEFLEIDHDKKRYFKETLHIRY